MTAENLEPGEVIRRSRRVAKWASQRYELMDDFYSFHSKSATGDFMQSFDEWCQLVEAGEDPLTGMERQYLLGLMTVTEDGRQRVRLKHEDRTARMTMIAEPRRRGAITAETERRIKDGDLRRRDEEGLGAYLDRLCVGLGYEVASQETVRAVRHTPLPREPPPSLVQAKAASTFRPPPPETPYREAEDDMEDLVPRSETTAVKEKPKAASPDEDDAFFI